MMRFFWGSKRLGFGAVLRVSVVLAVAVLGLNAGSVWATGGVTVSPGALTIEVGSSKTFTVAATNVIGDVAIASSNAGVARVNVSEWGTGMVDEGQTKSGEITVTGVSEGSATVVLTIDAATFDGEDLAGQTRTVTVNVVKAAEAPAPVSDSGSGVSAGSSSSGSSASGGAVSGGSVSAGSVGSAGAVSSVASGSGGSSGSASGSSDKVNEVASGNGSASGGVARSNSSNGAGSSTKEAAESDDVSGGGLSIGAILAGVGAVAVVAVLIGGAVWFVRKNR